MSQCQSEILPKHAHRLCTAPPSAPWVGPLRQDTIMAMPSLQGSTAAKEAGKWSWRRTPSESRGETRHIPHQTQHGGNVQGRLMFEGGISGILFCRFAHVGPSSGRVACCDEGGPERSWLSRCHGAGPESKATEEEQISWRRFLQHNLGTSSNGRPCPPREPDLPGKPAAEKRRGGATKITSDRLGPAGRPFRKSSSTLPT